MLTEDVVTIIRRAMLETRDACAQQLQPQRAAPYLDAFDSILAKATKEVSAVTGVRRIEKLETALQELKGFAERNSQRAEAAWKAADKELGHPYITSGTPSEAVQAASARWHEANRFRQVVVDRVKEALAP